MRLALCALAAALAGAPAAASDRLIEDVKSLDIVLEGTIGEHCSLGPIDNMHFSDLNKVHAAREVRVDLDCNVPFSIGVKSANGGLAHETLPAGQGPYAGRVPYKIALAVPVRMPAEKLVRSSFDSAHLTSAKTMSSQGGVAKDDMILNVEIGTAASEAGLLAGKYSETIEITVTPD